MISYWRVAKFAVVASVLMAGVAIVPAVAAPNGTGVNYCALATAAEVSAVLGTNSGPGTLDNTATGPQCHFVSRSNREYNVTLFGLDPNFVSAAGHAPGATPVAGVGDEAYWSILFNAGMFIVRKGNRALQINISLPRPVAKPTPAYIAFAKTVAGRF